jgi:hypothetical protein
LRGDHAQASPTTRPGPWPGNIHGPSPAKDSIPNDLHGHVRWLLVERAVARSFIADGDHVVVEAKGDNLTKVGVRYDNDCCLVFRLRTARSRRSGNIATRS